MYLKYQEKWQKEKVNQVCDVITDLCESCRAAYASITDPKEPLMLTKKKTIKIASFLSRYAIFMLRELVRMTELWLFISFQCKTKGKCGKSPQFTSILGSFIVAYISFQHLLSLIWSFSLAARAWSFSSKTSNLTQNETVNSIRSWKRMESVLWSVAISCGNSTQKSLPTLFFSAVLIYPAFASISIYHLPKVTVVTIINPVNRWPRRQDSIYRASSNHRGKLVLPKSEWGNYLNHLRPSISDSCVWWVHRPLTLGPSLLLSSLWIYFVRVSCTPDNLEGHKTVQPTQSLLYVSRSCEKCLESTHISRNMCKSEA